MDGMERPQRKFVGYEYKELSVDSDKLSFMIDGYEAFGWEIDENVVNTKAVSPLPTNGTAVLRLKRNRKIINKTELTRLQRNFEACVNEIDALEKAKTTKATVVALVVAMIGTAFMAGAVFAITASTPHIALCTFLAFPGIIGWILPYFIYKRIATKETEKMTVLIEAKYDEIYEICEKGNKLLF